MATKRKPKITWTYINLPDIADFHIEYNGKLYGGCTKRGWLYEIVDNKPKDVDIFDSAYKLLLFAMKELEKTDEYKTYIAKVNSR